MKSTPSLVTTLAPALQDRVRLVEGGERHTDFGGTVVGSAVAVVQSRSEEDVTQTLRAAAHCKEPVTVRGAGHSTRGQSVARSGVLLESYVPEARMAWLDDDFIEVEARSCWRHVERALNARGRQTPVLTDYLDLSVGGTLSVGGMGLNSITEGFQVDHVRAIRLIRPSGEALWCGADQHPEWFRFALAGLGQVGVIERVVLRTRPYRPHARLKTRHHPSVKHLADWLPKVMEPDAGIEHFYGYITQGQVLSRHGTYHVDPPSCSGSDVVVRDLPFWLHRRRVDWLAEYPEHVRLWTDFVFDVSGTARFLAVLENMLDRSPMSMALKAAYILAIRRPDAPCRFPLLPLAGSMGFGVGLYVMVSRWQPRQIQAVMHALRDALEICIEMGGRPYLYGFNPLDDALKHRLYGSDWQRLKQLREETSGAVLNPTAW